MDFKRFATTKPLSAPVEGVDGGDVKFVALSAAQCDKLTEEVSEIEDKKEAFAYMARLLFANDDGSPADPSDEEIDYLWTSVPHILLTRMMAAGLKANGLAHLAVEEAEKN